MIILIRIKYCIPIKTLNKVIALHMRKVNIILITYKKSIKIKLSIHPIYLVKKVKI